MSRKRIVIHKHVEAPYGPREFGRDVVLGAAVAAASGVLIEVGGQLVVVGFDLAKQGAEKVGSFLGKKVGGLFRRQGGGENPSAEA